MAAEPFIQTKSPLLIAGEQTPGSERRKFQRFRTDAQARILLVEQGAEMMGKIDDLSLGGCQLETVDQIAPRSGAIVEVTFVLNRLSLRLGGTVQWCDGWRQMGIRFASMSSRRLDDLQMLIDELKAAEEAAALAAQKAAEAAAAAEAAEEAAALARQKAAEEAATAAAEAQAQAAGEKEEAPNQEMAVLLSMMDRRSSKRHEINNKAILYPVRSGSRIECIIQNLSLGGCRLRTTEKTPFSIYTRVEVGFHAEGLPFRISGVVQNTREAQLIGVRFLDVSQRSQERLRILISELEEKRAMEENPADSE